jgi:hypothetical protein
MDNSYESLNELLTVAASKLDAAAYMIKELGFSPDTNIKIIGHALSNVFDIQHRIFEVRPDLQPDFLKKK